MWWLLLTDAAGAAPPSLDLVEVWREESGLDGALFGVSVASAGDVDGDGYDDIVVGASNYSGTFQHQGRAYLYFGSPRGPIQTAAWTEDGGRVFASFGCSVASAGDVNGDGFDDVIVGAYGDTSAGRAYVYLGSAAGLASAPVWTGTQPLPPDPAIGSFGFDVSSAGDVNGDGFDDLLVGDPHDGPTADDGKAFVYLGSATGPDTDPVWTVPGETLSGLGYAVAPAGDVNGDGFDDILVGATWSQTAYVFHGSPSGPEGSASWTAIPEQPGPYVLDVSSAGDVDGDGYDDVVVGVPYELTPAGTSGRVYVFHGGPTGLGDAASWIVDAESNMREFGVSVAAAGDVDRDGYDDILVGAGEDTNAPSVRPRVLLYRGSASGMLDAPAWTVAGGGVRGSLGMSVASAGDTDGDGYADVIAGAPRFENASGMTGQASVFLGSCQLGSDLDADGVGDVCDRCAGFDDRLDTDGDGLPNGCDGCPGGFDAVDPDMDRDGFCATVDCDDHDTSVFPGALEACNGRDDDCDGLTPDDETDDDLDRVLACAGDCDDRDGFTYPGALQRCDRVDNTCAGVVSSDEADADNDGYWGCAGDCDDGDPAVNLSADEVCGNGVDDNCDGAVDESCGCGCNGAAGFGSGAAVLLAGMLAVTQRRGVRPMAVLMFPGVAGAAAPTLDLVEVWRGHPEHNDAWFGWPVASAGDVNGDGYDDVIIGAQFSSRMFVEQGSATLYLGSPVGPGMASAWAVEGDQPFALLGEAVASAGDVNGDGYDDVVVGAYNDGPDGVVRVYLGSETGLGTSAWWTATRPVPLPEPMYPAFGDAVASAGDVNGDGYDDLLVGDSEYWSASSGKAHVYLGSPSGLEPTPIWTGEGQTPGDCFGRSVAHAGDVNGDGFSDILVGSWRSGVSVYLGSTSGPSTTASWTAGPEGINAFGVMPVAAAGDVNGDGYDDVLFAAPAELTLSGTVGRVYLHLGSAEGLSTVATWVGESDPAEPLFLGLFGITLASAGDLDGDGYDDVVIGVADDVRDESFLTGHVLVYLGSPAGLGATAAWKVDVAGVENSMGPSVGSADTNGDGFGDVITGAPLVQDPAGGSGLASVYLGTCSNQLDADADGKGDACDRCPGFDDAADADLDSIPDGCDHCPGAFDPTEPDLDGDTYCAANDCDDGDPSVFPGAPELCNGIDEDCDGLVPDAESDHDQDGVRVCAGDCDDVDGFTFPGAPELCDRVDNTCAGDVPLDEIDADNDGYWGCAGDCDDGDPAVNLSADEVCGNGVDDNCDGVVDESCGCGCNGAAGFGSAAAALLAGMLAVTRRKRAVC